MTSKTYFLFLFLGASPLLSAQTQIGSGLSTSDSIEIIYKTLELALRYEVLIDYKHYQKHFVNQNEFDNYDVSKMFINSTYLPGGLNLNFFGYKDIEYFTWSDNGVKNKSFDFLEINSIAPKPDGTYEVMLSSNLYIKNKSVYLNSFMLLQFEKAENQKWYYAVTLRRE
ncbi:MAG: hypothetical protein IT260_03390 [Saprospiraceae bacterium]|nr:hypothetical protein [Saprospiraceae bacterium]